MLQDISWIKVSIWMLAFASGLGFLAAFVAREKGYSYVSWFFIGFFFPVVGLIAAAGLPVKQIKQ
jgi:hypothetical protein